MRNLKRALSLALATVMTLGLMVVGTGAVGYEDVASEDNVEAIEVLQAVGIMTGDENGNFNPDNLVTRNEMAVVMSQLLNLNYNYYRGTNPFTDVPSWAAPYVAACAAEGVTSGIGDGLYGGDQNVTAAQAALMILKALGYFQYQADFEGDWQVTTIRQASYINLFDGIDASAEEALTRNQIAQLVLNGLKSNLVEFTGNVGATVGDVVIGHNTQYSARTNAASKYNTIDVGTTNIAENDQYYIQLGEELYDGDLELNNNAEDDFARPARQWMYDGKEIGTYMKEELIVDEYTVAIDGKTLYDLLGRSVIEDNYVDYYVDGKESNDVISADNMIRSNTRDYTTTGNGVLTQVFFDRNEKQITITSINTFLAKATDDFDEEDEELAVDIWAPDPKDDDTKVSLEEVPGIDAYQDGDMIMVQVAWDGRNYNIVEVLEPETIEDVTLTKYSVEKYVVSDGTQYDYALTGKLSNSGLDELGDYGSESLSEYTYNLYLDQYGYLIGNEQVTGSDKYVFITGYNFSGSATSISYAYANAIFTDGTMDSITVDVKDTQENIDEYNKDAGANYYYQFNDSSDKAYEKSEYNKWFTYTTDTNRNGETVYTLTPADNWLNTVYSSNGMINSYTVRLTGDVGYDGEKGTLRAYGDDESVYITVEADKVTSGSTNAISKINGVYTGVQDVDIDVLSDDNNKLTGSWTAGKQYDASVFAVYDSNRYIIAAIVVGEDTSSTKNYGYILGDAEDESYESSSNYHYWSFQAVVDGKIETLTIRLSDVSDFNALRKDIQSWMSDTTTRAVNGLVEFEYDTDGYVIDAERITSDGAGNANRVYDNENFGADTDPDDYDVYLLEWGSKNVADFDIYNDMHTLYNANKERDAGLTLDREGTVVVVETETYTGGQKPQVVWNEYDNLEDALEALGDRANKFKGYVAAALNDKGTAEWIVLNCDDPKKVTTNGGESIDDDYAIEFVNDGGKNVNVYISNGSTKDKDIVDADSIILQAWTTGQGYENVRTYTDVASDKYDATQGGHRFSLTGAGESPVPAGTCRVIVEIDGVTLTSDPFTVTH